MIGGDGGLCSTDEVKRLIVRLGSNWPGVKAATWALWAEKLAALPYSDAAPAVEHLIDRLGGGRMPVVGDLMAAVALVRERREVDRPRLPEPRGSISVREWARWAITQIGRPTPTDGSERDVRP